jgi:DNA-binding NarL/FixJ family response regulator
MAEIKIIVADGHSLFREGICSLLNNEPGIEVKGAGSAKDVLRMNGKFRPDVILLDWELIKCHDSDTCQLLKQYEEKTGILVMSTNSFDRNIIKDLRTGTRGFIQKNVSKDDLVLAIKTVAKGNYYFCKEAADILIKYLSNNANSDKPFEMNENASILSKREKDILKFISQGFTNSEIAEKLFISSHTVATHRRNLLQKINAKNTAGLVLYASKLGLLS